MNAQGSEAELTVAAERGRAGIDGELVGAAPEMTALGGNEHRIPVGAGRQRPGDDPLVLCWLVGRGVRARPVDRGDTGVDGGVDGSDGAPGVLMPAERPAGPADRDAADLLRPDPPLGTGQAV